MISKYKNELALFTICCTGLILLISNPGFYSHDEYQKIDHILKYNLLDYIEVYAALQPGEHFGHPMRPFSFVIQGLSALFIYDYPVITHLIDVIIHIAVVITLYRITKRVSNDEKYALVSALIFSLSPLVIYSIGWSAALMDRLYTLFILLTISIFISYIENKSKKYIYNLLIIASVSLALLSKETAIIIPAIIAIVAYYYHTSNTHLHGIPKKTYIAIACTFVPIGIYLLHRQNALYNSFLGDTGISGGHTATFDNILINLYTYTAYPFLSTLDDAQNIIFSDSLTANLALLLHIGLILYCFIKVSKKAAAYYILLYLIPITPVLIIPIRGSHYLYASGIAQSLFISYLLFQFIAKKNVAGIVLVALSLSILTVHSFSNQISIYNIGKCMAATETSLYAFYKANNQPNKIYISPDEGAPVHILNRLTFGREQIRNHYPITYIIDTPITIQPTSAARFSKECIIY